MLPESTNGAPLLPRHDDEIEEDKTSNFLNSSYHAFKMYLLPEMLTYRKRQFLRNIENSLNNSQLVF